MMSFVLASILAGQLGRDPVPVRVSVPIKAKLRASKAKPNPHASSVPALISTAKPSVRSFDAPATGALAAMQLRYMKRVNGEGVIPENALINGAKELMKLPEMPLFRNPYQDDAGIFSWEPLGPNKVGGRIRGLLQLNNTTWLAGSVGGGIWKTTDSGFNWAPMNDFLPSLAISSIVKGTGNRIYAGTGEKGFGNLDSLPGAGVFISDDGGSTWTQDTSAGIWRCVRLFAHPNFSDEIYAAVSDQGGQNGVWIKFSGEDIWTHRLFSTKGFVDVKVDKEDINTVVACSVETNANPDSRTLDAEVWLSTNGGQNWTLQTVDGSKLPAATGRCEVAFGPGSGLIYVSMDRNGGEIWRTTNNGATWQLRNSGSNYLGGQGWYGNTIWVAPLNIVNSFPPFSVQELVVVGGIKLFRSIDGGTTLTQISDGAGYHVGTSAHDDQHLIVPTLQFSNTPPTPTREVWFANDGGIQRTLNIDNVSPFFNWNNMNSTMSITQFYGGSVAQDSSGTVVGGSQDNDTLVGGISNPNAWFQFKPGDGGFCAIDPIDPTTMYGEYIYLYMFKTENSGASWFPIVNGLLDVDPLDPRKGKALFIAPFVHHPNTRFNLFAGGEKIWKTTNGGAYWSVSYNIQGTNLPKCSALAMTKWNTSVVWAGYENGKIVKSLDGGGTWSTVFGPPVKGNQFITDIAISPHNENYVFVTYGGYESDRIWLTTDGGDTWENRSGAPGTAVPAIHINTITFHPQYASWVYIGTDLGILASDDGGLHWNRTPKYGNINNDGPIHVDVEDLFFDNDQYLYAATHGRGMWRTWVPYTIYIDKAWGGTQIGTQSNPFNRVDVAVGSTGPAHIYSIKANDYVEGPKVYSKRGIFTATNGTARIR